MEEKREMEMGSLVEIEGQGLAEDSHLTANRKKAEVKVDD
jgi:hypothetical protein